MKQSFKVLNVKCSGCANTLKKSLENDFGSIDVNLEVEPRIISLDIEEKKIIQLREKLIKLGYPMSDEDLSKFDTFSTNAKSYISCAIGKIS